MAETQDPRHLLAELGRNGEQFAAAERRARTFLATRRVRDRPRETSV